MQKHTYQATRVVGIALVALSQLQLGTQLPTREKKKPHGKYTRQSIKCERNKLHKTCPVSDMYTRYREVFLLSTQN
jgi:hypothetical protein